MIRSLVILLPLIAVFAAMAFSIVRGPKILAAIQLILTVFLIAVFMVQMKTASLMHSMAYADPVRKKLEAQSHFQEDMFWAGAVITWSLYTFFHVTTISKKCRPNPRAD